MVNGPFLFLSEAQHTQRNLSEIPTELSGKLAEQKPYNRFIYIILQA